MIPRWQQIRNGIALALLGGVFLWGALRSTRHDAEAAGVGGRRVLVVAHSLLDTGIREALEEVFLEYERLHPDVDVRQLAVPSRIYPTWAITRLVGDMAPDLMMIGGPVTDDYLVRYILPLRDEMQEPNPWNAGTPLEGVPWRQTFIDGLNWPPSYSLGMFEVFGAPLTMFTARVYYNRDLLREITGSDEPPETFAGFLALCEAAREHGRRMGRPLVPVAASRNHAPALLSRMFQSQTQRLEFRLDRLGQLMLFGHDKHQLFLLGVWTLRDPEMQSGLALLREVGGHIAQGFAQLEREDAVFLFTQRRALMIVASSQDINSLRAESPFEVGAFAVPLPGRGDERFGAFPLGPISEGMGTTNGSFGVTLRSPNRELAIDFLRFLTSQPMSRLFTARSNWLPATVGVELPEAIRVFQPRAEGLNYGVLVGTGWGGEMDRVFFNHIHLLLGPNGSPERFAEEFEARYVETIERERGIAMRGSERYLQQSGTMFAAYAWLARREPGGIGGDGEFARKFGLLLDNESESEAHLLWEESYQDPEYIRGPREAAWMRLLEEP